MSTTTYTPASPYLQTFISKTLRITTTDTRVFVGELKCTDKDKNMILSKTHEYRYPTQHAVTAAAAGVVEEDETGAAKLKMNLSSRYLGLVVVPGEFVVKIEVEEGFAKALP